jgi:hypothetical protein
VPNNHRVPPVPEFHGPGIIEILNKAATEQTDDLAGLPLDLGPAPVKGPAGCFKPPSICSDCGVDLDEGRHTTSCLLNRVGRQHY